jgi:hypothetical protein
MIAPMWSACFSVQARFPHFLIRCVCLFVEVSGLWVPLLITALFLHTHPHSPTLSYSQKLLKTGKTPLDLARERDHASVEALLL